MDTRLQTLLARASELEDQIEAEITHRREALGGRIEHGRVVFAAEVQRRHRAARQAFLAYVRGIQLRVLLTAPVIYSLIVPIVLVDLWVTLYQWICFPAYGIARVKRRDFVVVDREHLGYLNGLEKLNCVYCGYANGVIAYVREVASRTEAYWCPIKHARRVRGSHSRYADFLDYGDEVDFVTKWEESRRKLRDEG